MALEHLTQIFKLTLHVVGIEIVWSLTKILKNTPSESLASICKGSFFSLSLVLEALQTVLPSQMIKEIKELKHKK